MQNKLNLIIILQKSKAKYIFRTSFAFFNKKVAKENLTLTFIKNVISNFNLLKNYDFYLWHYEPMKNSNHELSPHFDLCKECNVNVD